MDEENKDQAQEEMDDEKRMIIRLEEQIKQAEIDKARSVNTVPLMRASAKKMTQIKKGGADAKSLKEHQKKKGASPKKEEKKAKPKAAEEGEKDE